MAITLLLLFSFPGEIQETFLSPLPEHRGKLRKKKDLQAKLNNIFILAVASHLIAWTSS